MTTSQPRARRPAATERPVTDDPDQPNTDETETPTDPRPTDDSPTDGPVEDTATATPSPPEPEPLSRVQAPRLHTTGHVTLEVVADDRQGIVTQLADNLRNWRPDVLGWWVRLHVTGDTNDRYSGEPGRPARWTVTAEAVPVPQNMLDLYRRDITPPAVDHADQREAFYLEVSCPNCPVDGHGQPTRTAWVVEPMPAITGASPYALRVDPVGVDAHVDAADARWLQNLISRDLTGQNPIQREEALVGALVAGIEAMRLTREYVDPTGQLLPAVQSWDWFDWVNTAQTVIRDLGFTNDNEWHPEAPKQVRVPAPPVRPPADEEPDLFSKHRPGNGDGDITGDITRVEVADPTRVDAPQTEVTGMAFDAAFTPAAPGRIGPRTSGSTPAIGPRHSGPVKVTPTRPPGRWARIRAAWRGDTAAPRSTPARPPRARPVDPTDLGGL